MAWMEVKVPDIGDFDGVDIIEVLVKVGDTVKAEQSLITVESDKASMEIPSSQAGVVRELKVKVGDKVAEGTLLLMLESADAAPVAAPAPPAGSEAAPSASAATSVPTSVPASAPAAAATPAAVAPQPGGPVEVVIPDIGDFDEVMVIEVLVQAGDVIKAEQSLITVESDKASMEIPSSHAGTVTDVKVKVGDKVSKGSVLLSVQGGAAAPAPNSKPASAAPAVESSELSTPSAAVESTAPKSPSSSAPVSASASISTPAAVPSPATPAAPAAERLSPTASLPRHEPNAAQGPLPHASPSIRKLARELGVPLPELQGSGPKGRITQDDVQGFVKRVMAGDVRTQAQTAKAPAAPAAASAGGSFPGLAPWPVVDHAKFGPVERRDLSRIQKLSGAALHRNWVMIPHVSYFDDADITELEAFRQQLNKENEKSGVKVTMLAFIIKACVASLKAFPDFNSSLDGDVLVLKRYYNIGFAVDTPNGLVVPVLKDADQKGVMQISKEMGELAAKGRDGKLSSGDMSGGSFSISSLGGIGLRYFTPLINAPEVAIAGIGRSSTEPRWDGKAFQPKLILPVSLSWDHRVMDGAAAARFHTHLCRTLEDFRRVLL